MRPEAIQLIEWGLRLLKSDTDSNRNLLDCGTRVSIERAIHRLRYEIRCDDPCVTAVDRYSELLYNLLDTF